jgi:hypothetical protein
MIKPVPHKQFGNPQNVQSAEDEAEDDENYSEPDEKMSSIVSDLPKQSVTSGGATGQGQTKTPVKQKKPQI